MTVKNDGFKARQKVVHTFNIDFTSDSDNIRYDGAFTVKKLGIRDIAALGVRKAQLNGGMYHDPSKAGMGVDENTDGLNAMIAQLELSIIKAPTWWNLDEITDLTLLGLVFEEVMLFENSFLRSTRESNGQRSVQGSEGTSSGNPQQTNNGGVIGALVEQKVQSALEP